jgi:signal transduction histidine kinase
MQMSSIKFRLSLVFSGFMLLIFVLGILSIERLSDYNEVSADIRDRWLQNTRILGVLDDQTSDFRTVEGSHIFSLGHAEIMAREKELKDLDRTIMNARSSYERIHHSALEAGLYARFSAGWNEYKIVSSQVLNLSRAQRKAEAAAMYMTTSRSAFNAANKILADLINLNVTNAHEASRRAGTTYRAALVLMGIAMFVAGLMVAAAILYIRRSVSAPLGVLVACMRRLAGNETDIEIKGTERRDEIGEMARTVVVFRNNAVDLALSQHELALQASMLEKMLEDERRLTALQRNFVTMASHEFRTPLTIIDGHAQRMIKMKDRLGADDIAQRAAKLRGAVLQMTDLIDNLLNSSRLLDGDAGINFHPARIDLAQLLREVCQSYHEIAPGAQIRDDIGEKPIMVVGDPKLLNLVFSNILSNAVKYSPNDGRIDISAAFESEKVVVAVQDHGIGIPKKDLERLFERYYRGSNVSSIAGTGVGLHLVKMVVELHGGDIKVESREGEESRFTVMLPIKSLA